MTIYDYGHWTKLFFSYQGYLYNPQWIKGFIKTDPYYQAANYYYNGALQDPVYIEIDLRKANK